MKLLRQSTAAQVVTLPPLLDSTDGDTKETLLTPAAADVKLSKAGGAFASKNDATAPTVDPTTASPRVTLDDTDTDTLGELVVHMHVTGALYVERVYAVVPANVYDSLVAGTDKLAVDANAILDEAQSDHVAAGTVGKLLDDLKDEAYAGKVFLDPDTNTLTLYKADGVTVLKVFDLTVASGNVPVYVGRTPQ